MTVRAAGEIAEDSDVEAWVEPVYNEPRKRKIAKRTTTKTTTASKKSR